MESSSLNKFCDFDTWKNVVNYINTSGIRIDFVTAGCLVDLITVDTFEGFLVAWRTLTIWMLKHEEYFHVDFCQNVNKLIEVANTIQACHLKTQASEPQLPLFFQSDCEEDETGSVVVTTDNEDENATPIQPNEPSDPPSEPEDPAILNNNKNSWMNVKWKWKNK